VRKILEEAGFRDILISRKENSDDIIRSWNAGKSSEEVVFSGYVSAWKP